MIIRFGFDILAPEQQPPSSVNPSFQGKLALLVLGIPIHRSYRAAFDPGLHDSIDSYHLLTRSKEKLKKGHWTLDTSVRIPHRRDARSEPYQQKA